MLACSHDSDVCVCLGSMFRVKPGTYLHAGYTFSETQHHFDLCHQDGVRLNYLLVAPAQTSLTPHPSTNTAIVDKHLCKPFQSL